MTWIPTTQRLPGIGVRVLAWCDGHLPDFAYRTESGQWVGPRGFMFPTHWVKVYPPA